MSLALCVDLQMKNLFCNGWQSIMKLTEELNKAGGSDLWEIQFTALLKLPQVRHQIMDNWRKDVMNIIAENFLSVIFFLFSLYTNLNLFKLILHQKHLPLSFAGEWFKSWAQIYLCAVSKCVILGWTIKGSAWRSRKATIIPRKAFISSLNNRHL